jgi:hypothetical protein
MRGHSLARVALVTGMAMLRASLWAPEAAWAASPPADSLEQEEAVIPKKPSAPPPLEARKPVTTSYNCERQYLYKGKLLGCDSYLAQDGEKLRTIFTGTPAAIAELDSYQQGRRNVQFLYYTGSVGLAIVLVGFLFGKSIGGGNPIVTRNLIAGTGLIVMGGSAIYGRYLLNNNEVHLGNAVNLFNQSHPDNPVELRFSTGVNF